ncbi:hypothetical protein [Kitasatospora sp. NPDC057223]|uniref:hypothetical protein n=1 Tax=Kitasatospora sp. NPDC057223 TaxID=3346055 RepID=UPI00363A07AF
MTTDRRRLHRPLSAPPVDAPVQTSGRARLLAVERATLQEPVAPAEAVPPAVASSGRRRLSPGGLSFSADSTGTVSGSES